MQSELEVVLEQDGHTSLSRGPAGVDQVQVLMVTTTSSRSTRHYPLVYMLAAVDMPRSCTAVFSVLWTQSCGRSAVRRAYLVEEDGKCLVPNLLFVEL